MTTTLNIANPLRALQVENEQLRRQNERLQRDVNRLSGELATALREDRGLRAERAPSTARIADATPASSRTQIRTEPQATAASSTYDRGRSAAQDGKLDDASARFSMLELD